MNNVKQLIGRIKTVSLSLFTESIPLIVQNKDDVLTPAVLAGRSDLMKVLVVLQP